MLAELERLRGTRGGENCLTVDGDLLPLPGGLLSTLVVQGLAAAHAERSIYDFSARVSPAGFFAGGQVGAGAGELTGAAHETQHPSVGPFVHAPPYTLDASTTLPIVWRYKELHPKGDGGAGGSKWGPGAS